MQLFLNRLKVLVKRKTQEQDLQEEIAAHLQMDQRERMEAGTPPEEARHAARRDFGNVLTVAEDTRATWGWAWFGTVWQDAKHGFRSLVKNPGFTAVAALSLAVGVGANCAIFSIADMVLLRPLPVPQPSEVVTAGSYTAETALNHLTSSYPDYVDLRDRNRSFAGLLAFTLSRVRFARQTDGVPNMEMGMTVTGNFFDVLEVEPELGRGFRPEEDEVPGRDAVMVLSHDFWEQEFGGAPGVLGSSVWINDIKFTIVGVAPERFTSIDQYVQPAFYMPMMMDPRLYPNGESTDPMAFLADRNARFLTVKGRLKPQVSVEQAGAEVATIGAVLEQEYPETNRDWSMDVRTETEARAGLTPGLPALISMLLVLAAVVLLVACANVASLLTSRAPSRAREIAVRMAIGAGPLRLIRQLMTESVLLAALGAVLGVAVGRAGIALLDRFGFVSDVPVVLSLRLDQRALLFGLAGAALSVFVFGLIPAFRTARSDLACDLRTTGSNLHHSRLWGRNVLVVGQVAVALVLLTLSSFMYLSFRDQLAAGPGFRTEGLLTVEFDPSMTNYTEEKTELFYKNLTRQVRDLPGVRSAALTSFLPLTAESESIQIAPEGYQFSGDSDSIGTLTSWVDESYFDTMAIPIVEGRAFHETDNADTPRVAVVNEALAAQIWPGESPVGKRFRLSNAAGSWVEIVGVAKQAKYSQLNEAPTRFLYLPYAQDRHKSDMILLVESVNDAAALTAPVRDVVRGLDPRQPMFEVRTMEAFFEGGPVKNGLVVIQSVGAIGLAGMALALVGLYGLVSYSVSARTREIGIRMAIGASQGEVLRMVLRQGLLLAGGGIILGIVLSAAVARVMAGIFPGRGGGVGAYALVVPAALFVTLLAAYIPARRASRVNPIQVLRYD